MDDNQKIIEELKTEITGLKIRVKRLEDFAKSFPNPDDYMGTDVVREGEEPLYDEAVKIVSEYDMASASLLQRRLSIGYARAARLLDLLEQSEIVGPADGSNPRKVLVKKSAL